MPWIKPVAKTRLKLRPIDSTQLGVNEMRDREIGDRLGVLSARKADNGHWQVLLAGELEIGGQKAKSCYLWPPHWEGVGEVYAAALAIDRAKAISLSAKPAAQSGDRVALDVRYKSQMDNSRNPTGSCNVTSAAIVLDYWSLKGKNPSQQLEDELYEAMEAQGLSRHDPIHLRQIIEQYGAKDSFTTRATIGEIKQAIANGIPVIVHGYFTAFGHIVVIVGYDSAGFIVHDPYGEWFPESYDRNDDRNPEKGKFVHYSYGLIERLCLPDGGCWAHFITRPGALAAQSPDSNHSVDNPKIIATPRRFKPQEFRPNSIAAKIIGHFEGLELRQYLCPAGISTIGIGTTRWHDGGPIPEGATITQEQAIAFFKRDAKEFTQQLQQYVDVQLTARQIAALISWAYNNGTADFPGSGLQAAINSNGPIEEVRTQLRRWIKENGEPSDGLRRRRNAEVMLWANRDDWASAGYD